MDHLEAIKRYLLLEQGDFVQSLMGELEPSLSGSAKLLYRHNLTASLESAIRSSNAQFDDAEILKKLDVSLLEVSPGDCGWDVFILEYHVQAPLSTLFTPQAMQLYKKLFLFLWRLKRIEYTFSAGWLDFGSRNESFRTLSSLKHDLHKSQLVWSEMAHFNSQLQYYILFEIVESSWAQFMQFIKNGAGDLDLLIQAHNQYLNGIVNKGVLSPSVSI